MANKIIIEVTTGISPNSPYTDHTREYVVDADDWDAILDPAEQAALLSEKMGEAAGYANLLAQQRPGFWVNTDLRWPQ